MKAGLLAASIGVVLTMTQSATAAEVHAFVTGAARRSFETLVPQFERTPDTNSSPNSTCRPP
jgi:hypothetical protein